MNNVLRCPFSLTPRIQANLKSSTLYPAERLEGFVVNKKKKTEKSAISDEFIAALDHASAIVERDREWADRTRKNWGRVK